MVYATETDAVPTRTDDTPIKTAYEVAAPVDEVTGELVDAVGAEPARSGADGVYGDEAPWAVRTYDVPGGTLRLSHPEDPDPDAGYTLRTTLTDADPLACGALQDEIESVLSRFQPEQDAQRSFVDRLLGR